MGEILIDSQKFQKKIMDYITSQEVDKLFDATMFASNPESQACRQAMIHGMVTAGMMTCLCDPIFLEKRPVGHWIPLKDCANKGVYCSVCNKKVYKVDYANQKLKSKFCPNCGAKMEEG